jgi:hypothetical protein
MYIYKSGISVLTAVVMKKDIVWYTTPSSPLKVNHVAEEHVASRSISHARALVVTCFMMVIETSLHYWTAKEVLSSMYTGPDLRMWGPNGNKNMEAPISNNKFGL